MVGMDITEQMRERFERWDQLDSDSQGAQNSSQEEAEPSKTLWELWEPWERHKDEQSQGRMKMSDLSRDLFPGPAHLYKVWSWLNLSFSHPGNFSQISQGPGIS